MGGKGSRDADARLIAPLALGAGLLVGLGSVRALRRLRGLNELHGMVVLITGGSRGLGLALAREFARAGCWVAICARDRKELARAVEDLERRGAEGLAVRCDVSDPRQVARMVRRVTDRLGDVDILVNNAGIVQVGPLETMAIEDFEEVMAINFWGTVHPTLEILPSMRDRGDGRIVNITSIGGKVAIPRMLPYDCAKFAAIGFSQGLRAELAGEGVSVTTIVPGLMRTGGPANAWFKGDPGREYAWFSLTDGTSLTAMSAARAARRIVRAARDREAEVILTWQARLLALGHGLFPGPVAGLLGRINRALPKRSGKVKVARGMELDTSLSPSRLTIQMNRAARDLNQYGGTPTPSPEHARAAGVDGGGSAG